MSFFSLLAVLALLSFCIIKAQAAHESCSSLFSPNSSWLSGKAPFFNVTLQEDELDHTRKLTLFKQSSLSINLTTDQSLYSFTFTITNPNEDDQAPASLAFILVRSASPSSVRSMELRFDTCNKEPREHGLSCPPQKSQLDVCNPQQTIQSQPLAANYCPSEQDPDHSDETEVSLRYDAGAMLLHVQAVDYSHGLKINQTFTFSTNDSLPDATDSTLFVGYITSGNATINVTSGNATINIVALVLVDDNNAKSNHKKVVVWVIVGVSMMVFLLGLLILVLCITKRRTRPPSLVRRSHPAGGHGAPPSTLPFSHHDLESSETPMMKAKVALSPPPHTDAFQISGIASWLKQPNPR